VNTLPIYPEFPDTFWSFRYALKFIRKKSISPPLISPTWIRRPSPLWELADLKRYAVLSIQFSRGCPFNCDFCNVTALPGHRPRTKRVAQIVADFQPLLAFFRSIVRLGIVGREHVQYWKLFFWTLFHRPRLIALAVTLAIYGYHFRTVCEPHVQP